MLIKLCKIRKKNKLYRFDLKELDINPNKCGIRCPHYYDCSNSLGISSNGQKSNYTLLDFCKQLVAADKPNFAYASIHGLELLKKYIDDSKNKEDKQEIWKYLE